MFNCVVISPSAVGLPRMAFAHSLFNLLTYFSHVPVDPEDGHQALRHDYIEGSGVGEAYELLVAKWLEQDDVTHILTVEEDMAFEADVLHLLAKHKLSIVGCNYPKRVKGKGFTALGPDRKTRVVTSESSTGLEECYYSGFGVCLFERRVFEAVARPWFLIGCDMKTFKYSTQDGMFAQRLHDETDIKWYVDHDASKRVYHIGSYNYSYKDYDDDSVQ